MAAPNPDAHYHLLRYTDITEAAAFVAALSRFLSSPAGTKYLRPIAPAEVWSLLVGDAEHIRRIDIYLNTPALNAATDSFGRPPVIEKRLGAGIPAHCILLIGAGGVEAWGVEEAQWHLLAEG